MVKGMHIPTFANPGTFEPGINSGPSQLIFLLLLLAAVAVWIWSIAIRTDDNQLGNRKAVGAVIVIALAVTGVVGLITSVFVYSADPTQSAAFADYTYKLSLWISDYGLILDSASLNALAVGDEVLLQLNGGVFPVQLSDSGGQAVLLVTGHAIGF